MSSSKMQLRHSKLLVIKLVASSRNLRCDQNFSLRPDKEDMSGLLNSFRLPHNERNFAAYSIVNSNKEIVTMQAKEKMIPCCYHLMCILLLRDYLANGWNKGENCEDKTKFPISETREHISNNSWRY